MAEYLLVKRDGEPEIRVSKKAFDLSYQKLGFKIVHDLGDDGRTITEPFPEGSPEAEAAKVKTKGKRKTK